MWSILLPTYSRSTSLLLILSNQEKYIEKPLNAFMLYLKEQKAKVKAELNINNSAALNKVLGERWTSLSPENKDKYFQEAHKEQRLFKQKHPGWSSAQNYGKRRRKSAAAAAEGETGRQS